MPGNKILVLVRVAWKLESAEVMEGASAKVIFAGHW